MVFSCEFCEISKNTFFCRTPPDDCFWNLNRWCLTWFWMHLRNVFRKEWEILLIRNQKTQLSNRYLIFWYLVQVFLKYCDKLRQFNKQTVVELYGWILHNNQKNASVRVASYFYVKLNISKTFHNYTEHFKSIKCIVFWDIWGNVVYTHGAHDFGGFTQK